MGQRQFKFDIGLWQGAMPQDMKNPLSLALLQDEMQHEDILFVRNNEAYKSLPEKTINIMRYALAATPR